MTPYHDNILSCILSYVLRRVWLGFIHTFVLSVFIQAVLLSYYVQLDPSSLNSLTLQTEIPTHLRYGAPCPSSDLGSVGSQTTEQRKRSKLVDPSIAEDNLKYSTAGCLKNNQYRRFSLSSPIAFVNCGSEMRTEIVDAVRSFEEFF